MTMTAALPKSTRKSVLLLASCWVVLQLFLHCATYSHYNPNELETIEAPPRQQQEQPQPQSRSQQQQLLPRQQHQQQAHNLAAFPCILHFIWPNKDFDFGKDDPNHVEQRHTLRLIQRIKQNNPGWTVRIWTDDDCHALMRKHFPQYYTNWTSLTPQLKMWDTIRPCILWVEGGIYLDHDIDCDPGVKFNDWIQPHTRLLLRAPVTHTRNKIGNHFMGSIPHHPIWMWYIKNIIKDIPKNFSVVKNTGPLMLYYTFQQYVTSGGRISQEIRNKTIRLLALHEFENTQECEFVTGNTTYCTMQPHCRHLHSISPAELSGQDDNADYQVLEYRQRLASVKNYTKDPWACQRFNQMVSRSANETRPIGFVHVPKTGGTSIEHAIGFAKSCHATARDFQECSPKTFEKTFTFAAIRNPIDRIVSLYNYAKNGGNGGAKDAEKFAFCKTLSFAEFVEKLPSQIELNFAPQSHFITNVNGKVMVDEIICTETLSHDWKRLQSLDPGIKRFIGTLPAQRLRASSSTSRFMSNQVDNATNERLKDFFRDDFVLWEKYCSNKTLSVSSVAR